MRVLIVEDDADSAKMLATYLAPYGQCETAVDGKDALCNVKLAFEEQDPYNLICLDIMMPNMDGQQALKRIRDIELTRGIMPGQGARIVMTTALTDNKNILESFVSLSDGYIVKPFSKEELLKKLKDLRLIRA
jgi:two-component system chemotaxis response regulator CheY